MSNFMKIQSRLSKSISQELAAPTSIERLGGVLDTVIRQREVELGISQLTQNIKQDDYMR